MHHCLGEQRIEPKETQVSLGVNREVRISRRCALVAAGPFVIAIVACGWGRAGGRHIRPNSRARIAAWVRSRAPSLPRIPVI